MTRGRVVSAALAVGGFVAALGLAWHHMIILGDGFWTLATGRWMLEHGSVPRVDPFAYGSAGQWMPVSPGACLAFALIAKASGLRGLMMLGALLEATAATLLWAVVCRTRTSRLLLLPLALLFIQVDSEDLSCRGQLFGDLAFVLLLFALGRMRDGRGVHPALVVGGVALWTNLHLSFLAAIVVPIAAALLLLLEPPPTRPALRPFILFAALSAVATLLNPYGPAYLRLAFGTAFDPSTSALDLFQSPPFREPLWLLPPALGLSLAALRGRLGPARMRHPEQVFLLAVTAAACLSRRYATQLIAVEVALAAPLVDAARLRFPASERAVLAVAAFAAAAGVSWLLEPGDPERDVPVAAAAAARTEALALAAGHAAFAQVVNPLHWGGYLAYAWDGAPRYWIDGRDHLFLFGNGSFDDQAVLWQGGPGSLELLDTYEAGVVIWERGAPLDLILRERPEWQRVHADRIAVVYVRKPSD